MITTAATTAALTAAGRHDLAGVLKALAGLTPLELERLAEITETLSLVAREMSKKEKL